MTVENKCELCTYQKADVHASGAIMYCTNENGPKFGEITREGCDCYKRFNPKPDMSFKDALETIVMLPKDSYPDFWYRFNRKNDPTRPFMSIIFPNNAAMDLYREAHMKCFEELMKMKEEDGDFKEEEA